MDYYKELYDHVGSVIGWDFSQISSRMKSYGKKWDFTKILRDYLDKKTVLLDLGTGGGEMLLSMAPFVKNAYGIDHSESMIKTAKDNLRKSHSKNVEFRFADTKKIPFPDESFDVVSCRHAPFYVKEILRVMKPGGIFITQQVGEKDKQNIKKIFGRGQSFREKAGTLMNRYVGELRDSGFNIIRKETYNATEYYANMEDMIFLLRNTPIIPSFDIQRDEDSLKRLEKKYGSKKGIKTNSYRFVIIAEKQTKSNL